MIAAGALAARKSPAYRAAKRSLAVVRGTSAIAAAGSRMACSFDSTESEYSSAAATASLRLPVRSPRRNMISASSPNSVARTIERCVR